MRKPMREFMNITGALADETRIRTLLALRKGELCVCQITELFNLAPSTVSRHLSLLLQAGLVESRKDGRWIYYKLPDKGIDPEVRGALDWVERALAKDSQVVEDARKLKRILQEEPAALCKRQTQK